MTDVAQAKRAPSLLCCDGPCCGTALSQALADIGHGVRFEVATCLSECEKGPVVRMRYDAADGTRATALLSGLDERDLPEVLDGWLTEGAPPGLTPRLRAARFDPGEGGGCLCDEEETPPVVKEGVEPPR